MALVNDDQPKASSIDFLGYRNNRCLIGSIVFSVLGILVTIGSITTFTLVCMDTIETSQLSIARTGSVLSAAGGIMVAIIGISIANIVHESFYDGNDDYFPNDRKSSVAFRRGTFFRRPKSSKSVKVKPAPSNATNIPSGGGQSSSPIKQLSTSRPLQVGYPARQKTPKILSIIESQLRGGEPQAATSLKGAINPSSHNSVMPSESYEPSHHFHRRIIDEDEESLLFEARDSIPLTSTRHFQSYSANTAKVVRIAAPSRPKVKRPWTRAGSRHEAPSNIPGVPEPYIISHKAQHHRKPRPPVYPVNHKSQSDIQKIVPSFSID